MMQAVSREKIAKISTAPAAASLAFLASSCCSFVTRSMVYSMALFIISAAITTNTQVRIKHHSIGLIFKINANTIASNAASTCIRMFGQCRKISKIPLKACWNERMILKGFIGGQLIYKLTHFLWIPSVIPCCIVSWMLSINFYTFMGMCWI